MVGSNLQWSDKEKFVAKEGSAPLTDLKTLNSKIAHNVPVCVFPATLMCQEPFRPNRSQFPGYKGKKEYLFGWKVGAPTTHFPLLTLPGE